MDAALAALGTSSDEEADGMERSVGRLRAGVDALLDALTVLPFDEAAADAAATIRLELESRGMGLAMADDLIAGICGLVLSGRWLAEDARD